MSTHTTSYHVCLTLRVKKPKDTMNTSIHMQIIVAVMDINQAIEEAKKYLDVLNIQQSIGGVASLEFTDIIRIN
jgi:hypothetical protein